MTQNELKDEDSAVLRIAEVLTQGIPVNERVDVYATPDRRPYICRDWYPERDVRSVYVREMPDHRSLYVNAGDVIEIRFMSYGRKLQTPEWTFCAGYPGSTTRLDDNEKYAIRIVSKVLEALHIPLVYEHLSKTGLCIRFTDPAANTKGSIPLRTSRVHMKDTGNGVYNFLYETKPVWIESRLSCGSIFRPEEIAP